MKTEDIKVGGCYPAIYGPDRIVLGFEDEDRVVRYALRNGLDNRIRYAQRDIFAEMSLDFGDDSVPR